MRKQLVKNFGILIVMLGISDLLLAEDFSIELKTSPLTGALSELRIKGDKYNMNKKRMGNPFGNQCRWHGSDLS